MAAASILGTSDPTTEARAVAAELGFQNGTNGVTVTVANPPSAGSHAGDSNYVQVTLQQSVTPVLGSLIRSGAYAVKTNAVAFKGAGGPSCLLSLATSGTAVQISNNAIIQVPNCGISSNSASNSAITLGNNATVTGSVTVAGDVSMSNGASITKTVTNHTTATVDPYSAISLPARPGSELTASGSNLSPGYYPNGFQYGNNANITLQPGVYWVGTRLTLGNTASITGTGVTIILDGSYAISLGNNNTLNLTAPTSGATAGIALYSSPLNASLTQTFPINSTLNVTGAVYFPSQTIAFDNGAATGASACTQLVAKVLTFGNNSTYGFGASCGGVGTTQIGSASVASLVE